MRQVGTGLGMSIWSGMLDTIYGTDVGCAAVLTVSTVTAPIPVTVVDETSGAVIEQGSNLSLQTIKPACRIRVSELTANGLQPKGLIGGSISMQPGTPDQEDWNITSFQLKPGASGPSSDEVQMILVAQ